MIRTACLSLSFVLASLGTATAASSSAVSAAAMTVEASNAVLPNGLDDTLLDKALNSFQQHGAAVAESRYVGIIDYTRPSSEERFFLFDTLTGTAEVMLVAHGRGSDEAHQGVPTRFSNTPGSKMTSLGAYLTGETYHGKHGLSLRLHGLDASNDKALERAIVIHGADYVAPGRKLGRSWGCPALERRLAGDVIEKIKDGTFLYVHGRMA